MKKVLAGIQRLSLALIPYFLAFFVIDVFWYLVNDKSIFPSETMAVIAAIFLGIVFIAASDLE